VHTSHRPRAGKWAAAMGVSVACIPLVAIAPESWKVPLGIASMVFLAISLILLGAAEVRERRAAKSAPTRASQEVT
jgi:hypothetical protein